MAYAIFDTSAIHVPGRSLAVVPRSARRERPAGSRCRRCRSLHFDHDSFVARTAGRPSSTLRVICCSLRVGSRGNAASAPVCVPGPQASGWAWRPAGQGPPTDPPSAPLATCLTAGGRRDLLRCRHSGGVRQRHGSTWLLFLMARRDQARPWVACVLDHHVWRFPGGHSSPPIGDRPRRCRTRQRLPHIRRTGADSGVVSGCPPSILRCD